MLIFNAVSSGLQALPVLEHFCVVRYADIAAALWDNRVTQHIASWDYEGSEDRHGTRVTSLAEKPIFRGDAPSRREALGLDTPEAGQKGKGSYHDRNP